MKILYIQPHLGLGDSIVCNALVRDLATRHDLIIYPAKWPNRQSVAWMWSDLANVKVLGVDDDAQSAEWVRRFESGKTPVLRLGMHGGPLDTSHWGEQMYSQANVEWGLRWDGFKLPEFDTINKPRWYNFVHHDTERGFCIKPELLPSDFIVVQKRPTIWEYLNELQNAPQVHVIDSCFLCLADSVTTQGKLYFHKYARPGGHPPTLRKQWTILT